MNEWWLNNLKYKRIENRNKSDVLNMLLDYLYSFPHPDNFKNVLEPYIREFDKSMGNDEEVRNIGRRIGLEIHVGRIRTAQDIFIDKLMKVISNFGPLINVAEPNLPNGLPSVPRIINMTRDEFKETFHAFDERAYEDRLFLVSELLAR